MFVDHVHVRYPRRSEESDAFELELQVLVSCPEVLGNEPRASERAASSLSH